MCGIAGMVRHPDGADFEKSKAIVSELLLAIEHRGRHATGIAVIGEERRAIHKWAVRAGEIIGSDLWNSTLQAVDDSTRSIIGHVRHATLPNATADEAAHPFEVGSVVGCHNGVISNWREIAKRHEQEWIVDSQSILYLLGKYENPAKAFRDVEGSMALAWAKGGRVYLFHNEQRPLACAYVPSMRTLFWCSEANILRRVLKAYGVPQYDIWEPRKAIVYEYDPTSFDRDGSNPRRIDVLKAIEDGRRKRRKKQKVRLHAPPQGSFFPPDPDPRTASRPLTLADHLAQIEAQLRATMRRVGELEGEVERLNAENAHLFSLLSEDEPSLFDVERCEVCGRNDGELLNMGSGWIHQDCIFVGNRG